jgi:hypothetical protein
MGRRMSYADREIMRVLRDHPTRSISYDRMAAAADVDTRTAIRSVARLESRQLICVRRGRGCRPNSYLLM